MTKIDIEDMQLSAACPQCAALVKPPCNADFVLCEACGSTLVITQGVLTHILREEVRVSRKQAADLFTSWLGKQGYNLPTDKSAMPSIGEFCFFPFLRIYKMNGEQVVPLKALPFPSMANLAYAPAEFMDAVEFLGGADRSVDDTRLGLDRKELASSISGIIRVAITDPDVQNLKVEIRGYYPVTYLVEQGNSNSSSKKSGSSTSKLLAKTDHTKREKPHSPDSYSAIVSAGQGSVYPDQLPNFPSEPKHNLYIYLLALAAVLIVEAIVVPGLWLCLAVIVFTLAISCGALLFAPVSKEL